MPDPLSLRVPIRARSRRALLPALLLPALLLGGCGSAPEQIGATGIDELVIPTPEVDPSDFDDDVENPWFPLVPGTTAVYAHEGETLATATEVTVTDDTREIAGVQTSEVHRVVRSGTEVLTDTVSWYAVDDAGNVWLMGERVTVRVDGRDRVQSEWRAGEGGAEAGLAMPAVPRLGDGFAAGRDGDEVTAQSEVVAIVDAARVEYGDFDGLVSLSVSRAVLPGIVEKQYYARDVGLVLTEQSGDARARLELVEIRQRD